MRQTLDTYLGWEQLIHRPACKRPRFDVDLRTTEDELRYRLPGEERQHKCADDNCEHGNRFEAITVRIVCRSCGVAELVTGERTESVGRTSTSTACLGYGLPPRRTDGLFLWPGEPWLPFGRLNTAEPHDFLVTATRVERVERDDVVGQITQARGKRGGIVWAAAAVQSPTGPYGAGLGLRWAHAAEGFKTISAAAKYIQARLAEQQTGGAQ
ncbi:hypothetical protein ACPXCS_06075 [Streptomyces sp. DT190]|uniref:hypothetical protein n=1 Tax=unclassified Streptomyces TaxID=2593676 RepID=UPI003CE8F950